MKRSNILLVLIFSLFAVTSCKDWLDLEPEGEATSSKLTETGDGFRSMLSGVYKAMGSANLYGCELQFGLLDCMSQQYSWNWVSTETSSVIQKYLKARDYDYYDIDLRNAIDAIWKDGFNVIANANNLIQELEKASPDIFAKGETERKMILGEAYACRALMHFDLLRLFAPAPIENEAGAYVPYVDVYPNIQPDAVDNNTFIEKVIADLKHSLELTIDFDTSALGQSSSASAKSRFKGELEYAMEGATDVYSVDEFFLGRGYRLSYYATMGILARVYQYAGKHEEAFEMAKTVLEYKAHGIDGVTTYDMFSKEDFSGIMQSLEEKSDLKLINSLLFAIYNEDAYEDYNLESFFKTKADGMNIGNWFVLDKDQKIFENPASGTDERTSDYRGNYLLFAPEYNTFYEGSGWYVSAKWYCSTNAQIRDDNAKIIPVMRATELRYIMAEYYARNGQFGEAYNILNQIRQNRGMWDNLPEGADFETFQRDLIRDAQREWISEGQLFYLYKRLGAKFNIKGTQRKMTKSEYMLPVPDDQNM